MKTLDAIRGADEERRDARRADTDTKFETRRAATDSQLAERHAGFDLAAQDRTPKYHRPHFAVVGEGTKSANRNYRANYGLINWAA